MTLMDSKIVFDPNKVYEFKLDEILADEKFNVRGHIDATEVIELANDIKNRGLDAPITVQPWDQEPGKKFRILAGHRRFKAHQLLKARGVHKIPGNEGEDTVRCLIKTNVSELDAHVINITENIQRKDLNILQEARGIDIFFRAGWSDYEVARRIGMSRGWVQVRFMLLSLPEAVQKEAAAGLLTGSDIRKLASLNTPDEQYDYVKKLKDRKWNKSKKEINLAKIKVKNEKRTRTQDEIFSMQDILREEVFGRNNEVTRILGWAAGVVSDLEIHQDMQKWAERTGRRYIMPQGLKGTHAV